MPTPAQIGLARTLLAKTGLAAEKDTVIRGFTANRTESISSMTDAEFKALIAHLKGLDPASKSAEKQRRKIISMAHEMHWHMVDAQGRLIFNAMGKPRADMKRIDGWCENYSSLKKKLDSHTLKELPALVSQFEKVYNAYIRKL